MKESSIREALRDGSPNADSESDKSLRKDCSFSSIPLNVERLSCSGYICKVRVFNPLGGGEQPVAYTLRRYQP